MTLTDYKLIEDIIHGCNSEKSLATDHPFGMLGEMGLLPDETSREEIYERAESGPDYRAIRITMPVGRWERKAKLGAKARLTDALSRSLQGSQSSK